MMKMLTLNDIITWLESSDITVLKQSDQSLSSVMFQYSYYSREYTLAITPDNDGYFNVSVLNVATLFDQHTEDADLLLKLNNAAYVFSLCWVLFPTGEFQDELVLRKIVRPASVEEIKEDIDMITAGADAVRVGLEKEMATGIDK